MSRSPLAPTLFPSTTLFRSMSRARQGGRARRSQPGRLVRGVRGATDGAHAVNEAAGRSEEHTSELQSPDQLVCRLLLEKKKKNPSAFTQVPLLRSLA